MYDYLIVGAGLYGSVFAQQAVADGKKVLVIDKRPHIGGNCFTEEKNNIIIHKYGAHIFHTRSKEIWDYIRKFAFFNHYIHRVKANYDGDVYSFPINLSTIYQIYEVDTIVEAKKAMEMDIELNDNSTIEGFALRTVGRKIYETFIKGYTEKQWDRPASELPSFILRRIPIRMNHNDNYFNDRYQGIPVNGYTEVISNMLNGAEVITGEDYFENKDKWNSKAKVIVYTGMIDKYYDHSYGELEYRSLKFDTKYLNVEDYQGISVMNYTSNKDPHTRILEHKHFTNRNSEGTYITHEYPAEFRDTKEPYYPIGNQRNNEMYQKYHRLAQQEKNLIVGGRLGSYRYYDMCDAIAASLATYKKFRKYI